MLNTLFYGKINLSSVGDYRRVNNTANAIVDTLKLVMIRSRIDGFLHIFRAPCALDRPVNEKLPKV